MARVRSVLLAGASLFAGVLGKVVPRQQGSLPTVTSEGNAFWKNGERFYIRGVAYQPGGEADAQDPLLDMQGLTRDIARFEELGINTIRVYTIDNSQNHDEAMQMLDDAGIYLALDANTPDYSLNRASLQALHDSYNDEYLRGVFSTIDNFAGYNTNAAPYVKAVTRDMKQYISAQAPRPIPVGYSSADIAENIESQALYFACGEDEWARSDFFAFNDYSWCEPSSFEESGWDVKVQTYSNYSLPLFLSEFGCIKGTRTWGEIEALYSEEMTVAYSGGLVYEYTLETNGFGLVEQSGNGITPNADFRRLKTAYQNTPSPTGDGGARKSRTAPSCPPRTSDWNVNTENLPEIPAPAVQYIRNGVNYNRGPGLDGDGSQWAGAGETSETSPDLRDGVTSSNNPGGNGQSSGSGSGSGDGNSNGSNGGGNENGAVGLSSSLSVVLLVTVGVLFATR